MVEMVNGLSIAGSNQLQEGYTIEREQDHWTIRVLVGADRLSMVYRKFIEKINTPGYLTVEVPTDLSVERFLVADLVGEKTVQYGIGGLDPIHMRLLYDMYEDLFIHDGRIALGIGSHDEMNLIVLTDTKSIEIHTQDLTAFVPILQKFVLAKPYDMKFVSDLVDPSRPLLRSAHVSCGDTIESMLESLSLYGLTPAIQLEEAVC